VLKIKKLISNRRQHGARLLFGGGNKCSDRGAPTVVASFGRAVRAGRAGCGPPAAAAAAVAARARRRSL